MRACLVFYSVPLLISPLHPFFPPVPRLWEQRAGKGVCGQESEEAVKDRGWCGIKPMLFCLGGEEGGLLVRKLGGGGGVGGVEEGGEEASKVGRLPLLSAQEWNK